MDQVQVFQVLFQFAIHQAVRSAQKIEGRHVVGARGAGVVKVDHDVLVRDQLVKCGEHIPEWERSGR